MKRFVVMAALVLCSSLVSAQNTITCSIEEAAGIIGTLEARGPGYYEFQLSGQNRSYVESRFGYDTTNPFAEIVETMRQLPEGYYISLDCTRMQLPKDPPSLTFHNYYEATLRHLNDIDSLASIILPSGMIEADSILNGCKNLVKVFIPATIEKLPAFKGSPNVKVSIAAGNPYYSSDETGKIILSKDKSTLFRIMGEIGMDTINKHLKGVTYIGPLAFEGNTYITEITLPNGLTHIGYSAFEGCTALTEISLPSTLTYIGHSAFEGCTALTNVTFHSNKRYDLLIDDRAFLGCSSLTTISIPSNVTEIHSYAFFDCERLSHVEIWYPMLGNQVFGKCPQLERLTSPSDFNPPRNTFDDTPEPRQW